VLRAQPPVLRGFQIRDRRVELRAGEARRPAIVTRLRVAEPLEAIDGVATSRAAMLRARGIGDVVALSRASVATVAALPGVSPEMAEKFIAEARTLVRERGVRVVFD
jgi:hypothetical protein